MKNNNNTDEYVLRKLMHLFIFLVGLVVLIFGISVLFSII